MWEQLDLDFQTFASAVATLFGFFALACIPLVLLRKKEASSTVAWIMTLLFLPIVGVVLFWFLGRDRVRRPAREKREGDASVRERVSAVEPGRADEKRGEPASVMRLATHVGVGGPLGGNDVRALVGAPATYDAIIDAIEGASHHVHLEYYIFRPDVAGTRVRDALVRAAGRGVEVRVLLDAYGSRGAGRRFFAPLLAKSGELAKFFPLDPVRRAWTVNLRNHRKLVVVDGRVGFTGGINIGDEFLPWRDLHLRIEGPAVRQLQQVFVADWYFATRKDVVSRELFGRNEQSGTSVMQLVQSGPDTTVEAIHHLYFAAIASAQKRVLLSTPYFVPDRALLVALQTAALRGVVVRLVLPSRSNHRVTFHAGRSFYDELLGAGVHVHEYEGGFVHSKIAIVDGSFATVGTANLDVRSFRLNFELIGVLWDAKVVADLEALFEDDLAHSKEVDLATWRARGLSLRIAEGVGRLFAPLL